MTGKWVSMTAEDLGECAALYVQVFNTAPWNDTWTVDTAYKRLLDIHDTPGFVGRKYVVEDKIKGAVLGNLEQWYKGKQFNLKEMYVSNDMQGTGIGSQLFPVLEEELKPLDVGTIFLFTSRGYSIDRFYLKNGFSEYDFMVMMGKNIVEGA